MFNRDTIHVVSLDLFSSYALLQINYWKEEGEDETMAFHNPISGQTDRGLAIALEVKTYYFVNVQVFNSAGNGPKSEDFLEETLRYGELDCWSLATMLLQ